MYVGKWLKSDFRGTHQRTVRDEFLPDGFSDLSIFSDEVEGNLPRLFNE